MKEPEIELEKEELKQVLNKRLQNLKELAEVGKNSNYIKELSDIAFIQLQLEKYPDSEKNYLICLKHFGKQKDRLGQAAVYGVLGILYFKMGDYKRSIESYEKAYNIYDELNQVQEKITCLIGIGNNYIKMNKLDESREVFLKGSAICSESGDIYNLLDCLGNLIYIHEKLENWDILYELYKKSLEAFKEIRDNKGIITSHFNLGILQKRKNNFNHALRHFKKGTNKAIDANYTELIIRGLSYVGETFFYLGEIKQAKDQYIKALYLANKIKAKNAILQLKVLLHSLGLQDKYISDELKKYEKTRK